MSAPGRDKDNKERSSLQMFKYVRVNSFTVLDKRDRGGGLILILPSLACL